MFKDARAFSGFSALRTYLENARAVYAQPGGPKPLPRVDVPSAVAVFPVDVSASPREWAERMVNVKRFTKMPKGGHFAALEVPELFVNDSTPDPSEVIRRLSYDVILCETSPGYVFDGPREDS